MNLDITDLNRPISFPSTHKKNMFNFNFSFIPIPRMDDGTVLYVMYVGILNGVRQIEIGISFINLNFHKFIFKQSVSVSLQAVKI